MWYMHEGWNFICLYEVLALSQKAVRVYLQMTWIVISYDHADEKDPVETRKGRIAITE